MESFILQRLEDIENELVTAAGSSLALTEFQGKYSELLQIIDREVKNGSLSTDTISRVFSAASSVGILARTFSGAHAKYALLSVELKDEIDAIYAEVCYCRDLLHTFTMDIIRLGCFASLVWRSWLLWERSLTTLLPPIYRVCLQMAQK